MSAGRSLVVLLIGLEILTNLLGELREFGIHFFEIFFRLHADDLNNMIAIPQEGIAGFRELGPGHSVVSIETPDRPGKGLDRSS